MKLLLDTHAVIWWYQGNLKMSASARAAIDDERSTVLVSVVSAFELTTKHRIGKLSEVTTLLDDLSGYIASQGFGILPLSLAHVERAGRMDIPHRDPFDRLLIAQAQVEQALLVSNETLFDHFAVRRLW